MHVANVTVKNTWQDLETLITSAKGSSFTFDADKNYYLSNGGGNVIYCVNAAAQPSTAAPLGLAVFEKEQCGLRLASGKVFVSTQIGQADLHIESED